MLILGCKPIKETWPSCRKRSTFAFHGQLSRLFPNEHFAIKNKDGVFYVAYPYDEDKAEMAIYIAENKPYYWDEIAKIELQDVRVRQGA